MPQTEISDLLLYYEASWRKVLWFCAYKRNNLSGYRDSAEDIEHSLLDLFSLYHMHLLIPGILLHAWLFRNPPKSYTKHLRWWHHCIVGLATLQWLSAFPWCPPSQGWFPIWCAASHSSLLPLHSPAQGLWSGCESPSAACWTPGVQDMRLLPCCSWKC